MPEKNIQSNFCFWNWSKKKKNMQSDAFFENNRQSEFYPFINNKKNKKKLLISDAKLSDAKLKTLENTKSANPQIHQTVERKGGLYI